MENENKEDSEKNFNMNIDKQAGTHSCQQCNTPYKDFPSLVNHRCRPNLCPCCGESFDMDFKLAFHLKNCHNKILGDKDDKDISDCKSNFADSMDENSQLHLNHIPSCDVKRSCEMCKKLLSSRNKTQFCPTCTAIIKNNNRDYNLRVKNISSSHKKVLSTSKNALNDNLTNIEKELPLDSDASNLTAYNKDEEASSTQPTVKCIKNSYPDSIGRNAERKRNIDESEQNIHALEAKIKNSTIKYLEDVEHISSQDKTNSIVKDVSHLSEIISVQSNDRKKLLKRKTNENSAGIKKQRHRLMNRKAEAAAENNVNSELSTICAPLNNSSKVLTSEEQSKRSRNGHLKKTVIVNTQPHSKSVSGTVSLSSLINSLPDNDCGILLQSQSTNDSNFKCAKCNKVFRSSKLGAAHFPTCKASRFKKTLVDLADVKWVCVVCQSHFNAISELIKHKGVCFDFRLQPGPSKQNVVATVYDSISDYERACMNWCPKCSYRCVSSFSLLNHSCEKRLLYMRSCFIRCRKLPVIDVEKGAYLYECKTCKMVFIDNYLYSRHMASHRMPYENVKPLILNPIFRPEVLLNIKTEPVPEENEMDSTLKLINSLLSQKRPVSDPSMLSNYILSLLDSQPSTPSKPQSSIIDDLNELLQQFQVPKPPCSCAAAASNHSATSTRPDDPMPSSSAQSSFDFNQNYHFYNLLVCQCRRRVLTKDEEDYKPCPNCLTTCRRNKRQRVGSRNFDTGGRPEPDVNNVGTSKSSSNSTDLEIDATLSYENGSIPVELLHSLGSNLTPPVSHSGLTPPPTPDNFMTQYPKTPGSSIDGMVNEAANAPSATHQLLEARSPSSPTCMGDGFSDDENMSELQIDFENEPEVAVSNQQRIPITHIWTEENSSKHVDAWAILSSNDSNVVEKYVCLQCFCSHDQNSLPNHLREKHGRDISEIISLYMVTPAADKETEAVIESLTNG